MRHVAWEGNRQSSFQTVGLVTDVEPFLRVLVQELDRE